MHKKQRDSNLRIRPLSSRLRTGRLRRSTLVYLRWMAIIGQSLALLIVAFVLQYDLPIIPGLLLVMMSALVNLFISIKLPLDRRVNDLEAVAQLGFDVLQLAGLLWLSGGMINPFALLFLAPVVTGAATLSRPVFAILSLLSAGLSLALVYFAQPLPWSPPGGFSPPPIYTLGAWVALMIGMAFTSLYAWRAAMESRRMSDALAATEAVLAHEQKLAALGSLAAAAAHELGTPLATIQIAAKEMARELEPNTSLGEDARLLLSQSQRCREILKQLSIRGDEGDIIHDSLSLDTLLQEAARSFEDLGVEIHIRTEGEGPTPIIRRQSELLYGLKNLIENAVSFAHSATYITGQWTDSSLSIHIEDDGPGFNPMVLAKLGEPYVSGRPEKSRSGGLGLGLFIAKTLLGRTGGHLTFGNSHNGGAMVQIIWPRGHIDTT